LKKDNNNNIKPFQRLRELLFIQNISIPYIAFIGDYVGCCYKNWKSTNGNYYSLPLFTVAAAINCNYSIPIPNYKTISDSQMNISMWDIIMEQWKNKYIVNETNNNNNKNQSYNMNQKRIHNCMERWFNRSITKLYKCTMEITTLYT
jgi:hypothetical protein